MAQAINMRGMGGTGPNCVHAVQDASAPQLAHRPIVPIPSHDPHRSFCGTDMGCTSTKLHDIKSGVRGGRKCEKPPASNQSPSGPQAGQSPQHKSKGPVLNEEDLVAAAPTATTTSSSGTTMRTSSPTSGPKGPGSPHGRAGSPGRGALPEPERSDSGAVRHDDVNFSSPMSPVRQHYLSPVQTPPDSPRDQRPRALSTCVPARGTCRAADGGDMLSFLSSAPNFHESSYFRMYHFTSKDAGDLRAFSDPQIAERLPEWERYTARYAPRPKPRPPQAVPSHAQTCA